MKKLLFFIFNFCIVAAMGQNLIAPVTISLPVNPPANTADWATAMPPVMINAQSKLRNGQVPGEVIESRILVTIKSGGSKICGMYTQQTAPGSSFNSITKTWSGAAVAALLGQDCILKPGSYELCVQFYNLNPAAGNGVLGEACKVFTIADTKQETYSPPQNVIPPDGKIFTEQETNQPIIFRWVPVLPRPKEDIIYKVHIVEIKKGQSKTEALKTNTPLDVIEVKNATQTTYKLAPRCHGCGLESVWNVEAVGTERRQGAEPKSYGTSEATSFSAKGGDVNPEKFSPPVNQLPADGKVFNEKEATQPVVLRWVPVLPKPKEDVIYKVRVTEIKQGQSKVEAIRANTPIEILEVKNETQVTSKLGKRCNNCEYVWNVEASKRSSMGDIEMLGTSEATTYSFSSQSSMMMAQCNFTPRLDSIYCLGSCGNGKTAYRVRIKLDNTAAGSTLMNFANATNYGMHTPIAAYSSVNNSNNLIQAWNTSPSPYGAVNPLITATPVSPFYPTTITAGTAPLREVDICVPDNTVLPIRLRVFISMVSSNGVPGLCDDDVLINTLPPCPCTYCKDDMIQFSGQNTITDANNILTLNNSISIPGIQVKQFKAELIGISYNPQNGNQQCWVCNKEDDQWGNFTAGTFSSPYPAMVNGVFPSLPCCGGNSHHTIGWWGAATTITNRPLQLKISLPPASTLSCCPYNVMVCVRYTFTDAECRSCSVVKCFSYVRQPQSGGGPLDISSQVSDTFIPGEIKN